MEMRLRPEQWLLLGILGVALALVVLQVQHNIALPALRRAAPETPPAGAPPSASAPQSAPAASAAPPDSGAAQSAAPPAAFASPPDPPPPAPSSPALALRAEPQTASPGQPVLLYVTLDGAADATEVFFDLRFEARRLAPDAAASQALGALAAGDQLPRMQVDVPEPGRVVVQLRRGAAPAGPPAGADLCLLHFTAGEPGSAALHLTRAGVRLTRGDLIGARGGEATVEVR